MSSLLKEDETIDKSAERNAHRYSRKVEMYCHLRYLQARGRRYQLFWLNMHYFCGLMEDSKRKGAAG